MSEIYFDDIIVKSGRVEIYCKSVGDDLNIDEILYFIFSEDILVNDNQIAIALASLCGSVYDFVYMDLNINYEVIKKIKNFINGNFLTREISYDKIESISSENILLCFSGGFDSLAAYAILDSDFDNFFNVSLDFGGRFSREENFFKRFPTSVVKTNFVDLKLNRNSTSFMYIPIIFYCNYFDAGYGILADTLESGNNLFKRNDELILSFLNLKNFPLTFGMTEVGTALIILNKYPELVDLSLKSLANPGEEKRYRKQLFIKILSEKYGQAVFFEEVDKTNSVVWGNNVYSDFLCLYFIKRAGVEVTSKIIRNIPIEAINLANALSLNFYEKINVDFLEGVPEKYKSKILFALFEFGIYPYDSDDFREFNEVLRFLSQYHSIKYSLKSNNDL